MTDPTPDTTGSAVLYDGVLNRDPLVTEHLANAALIADALAELQMLGHPLVGYVRELTERTEKAEARVAELEPQLRAYPTPAAHRQAHEALGAQRVRATEAETVADELRARLAALGEPEIQHRVIAANGGLSWTPSAESLREKDRWIDGWHHEIRDAYFGDWRPFGTTPEDAFTLPPRAEIERQDDGLAPVRSRIRQALGAVTGIGDIDHDRLGAILVAVRRPSSLDLALIADHCKVTVEWLLTGDEHGFDGRPADD